MNDSDVIKQSKSAYAQWSKQWRLHATEHAIYEQKPFKDFENSGVGKAVLCVALGASFEENIETIKKYQHNVDIMCCDKTLGHLLDHGITPKYCVVADANVNYDTYCKKWKDQLSEVTLFINVCGNPKWTKEANWKDRYFFINMDAIKSEREFSSLSGCKNTIAAGTNVSNAMVILLTQCDNIGRRNFFGYDKILIIGYDYSWEANGKYYAFNDDADGKSAYMKHVHCINNRGNTAFTSNNLMFSCQWFHRYIKVFDLPVVQCTKSSILRIKYEGDLAEQMQYKSDPEDRKLVDNLNKALLEAKERVSKCEIALRQLAIKHYFSMIKSVDLVT